MTNTILFAHCLRRASMFALSLGVTTAMAIATAAPASGAEALQAARQAIAEGEYGAATRDFAEAVRRDPGDATALNNLAVALAATGDYQGALALLLRARKAAPARADIGNNLAVLQAWARHYHSSTAPVASRPGLISAEPPALWGGAPLAAGHQACAGGTCK